MPNPKFLQIVAALLAVGACTNTGAHYQPVTDGPVGSKYNIDLQQCQQLAALQASVDGSTAGNAAIGAAGAAVVTGIVQNNRSNMGRAAVAGGLVGAGLDVINKNQNKEVLVRNCMRGRGYNVVG